MAFERILILVLIFIIGAAWLFLVSKKRVLLVSGTIIILAAAIGYCLIMANRYKAHNLDCVSTDKENILREMPSLEFSEEEMSRLKDILKTPFITAYMKEGEQRIPEEEIGAFLNDVIPSEATNVSDTLYDDREGDNSQDYVVLNITYTMDELKIDIYCYDTGSVIKGINQNSGKIIYENENNENFRKYILKRNWFAWMKY